MWEHIEQGAPNDCWRWTGPTNPHRGDRPVWRRRNASRALWIEIHGEPPEGHHVEHLCERSWCVNPSHLRAVPPEVNYARLRWEMCGAGLHEMTDENRAPNGEYADGRPRYRCRVCENERSRRRKRERGQSSLVEAGTGSGDL